MQCDALLLSLVVARVQLHSLLLITILLLLLLLLLLRRCASIQMQNEIGADVIMALDDVISSQTTGERVEEVPIEQYFCIVKSTSAIFISRPWRSCVALI